MRKSIKKMLSKQCAKIEFVNNKVKYFSISTQHGEADTLKEAIDNIIKADKKYKGQTPLHYMIDEGIDKFYAENKHIMPAKISVPKDFQVSLDELRQSVKKWQEEYGKLWLCILHGENDGQ